MTQAYERLQQLHPRPNARHLVIHCQYPSYSQLQRLKAAGAYPCFFISPLYHWGEIHAGYVGADRVARFCPAMTLMNWACPTICIPTPPSRRWIP